MVAQRDSYVSFNDLSLYKMDALLCDTQLIGHSNVFMADIAITPSRNLYAVDFYKLYQLDTLNAFATYIADIDSMGAGFNALAALNDDYLLAVRVTSEIYKIKTSDGSTSLVGTCGYYPAGDITFYKGFYYMVDILGNLIKIKFNDDFTSITAVVDIGNMETPYDAIYGILAVGNGSCTSNSLKLLVFEGYTAYEVNASDASLTIYCDTINEFYGGATGATSLTETKFQGYGGILEMPNVFTPNNDNKNDYFSSAFEYGISSIHVDVFDRWGKPVFSNNKSENLFWDGTNNRGDACSEGVYYYLLNCINYCGEQEFQKGFVHLIR